MKPPVFKLENAQEKPKSRNYTQHTFCTQPSHFPTSSGENLSLPLLTNLIGTLPLRS